MAVEGMPNYPASFLLALPLCIWIMMEKGHRSGAQSCCLEESYQCQLRRVSSLQGTSHSALPGARDPWSHGAAAGKNLNPCTRVTCHWDFLPCVALNWGQTAWGQAGLSSLLRSTLLPTRKWVRTSGSAAWPWGCCLSPAYRWMLDLKVGRPYKPQPAQGTQIQLSEKAFKNKGISS